MKRTVGLPNFESRSESDATLGVCCAAAIRLSVASILASSVTICSVRSGTCRLVAAVLFLELGDAERPERTALLGTEVPDPDGLPRFREQQMRRVDVELVVIEEQLEACAPVIEARTMTHHASLRRGDVHRARVHFELVRGRDNVPTGVRLHLHVGVGRRRFAVTVENRDRVAANTHRRRHDEPQRLTRAAHLVARPGIAHRRRDAERREIERPVRRDVRAARRFLARIDDVDDLSPRWLRVLTRFAKPVNQQRTRAPNFHVDGFHDGCPFEKPRPALPCHARPNLALPRQTSPCRALPDLAAPRQTKPRLTMLRLAEPRHASPHLAGPDPARPRRAPPYPATPEPDHASPRPAAPCQTSPRQTTPGRAAPNHTLPRLTVPDRALPRPTSPYLAMPRHATPCPTAPCPAMPCRAGPSPASPCRASITPLCRPTARKVNTNRTARRRKRALPTCSTLSPTTCPPAYGPRRS